MNLTVVIMISRFLSFHYSSILARVQEDWILFKDFQSALISLLVSDNYAHWENHTRFVDGIQGAWLCSVLYKHTFPFFMGVISETIPAPPRHFLDDSHAGR